MDCFRFYVLILIAAALGLSCSDAGQEGSADALPPGYSDGGEIMLEETLVVGESTGVMLGSVGGVVANGEGTIFVADPENVHIRVFSPTGDSLTTIGRKGQGPGEFQNVYQLYMTEDDSLIAHDRRARQFSVFQPKRPYDFSHSINVPRLEGAFPSQVLIPDTAGYAIVYHTPFGYDEEGQITPDRWLAWFDETGDVVRDTVLIVEGHPGVLQSTEGGRVFYSIPFADGPQFAEGPGGTIVHGRTDSLRISQYRLDGTRLRTVRLDHQPIPLSKDEIDSVVTNMSTQAQDLMQEAEFPDLRPAFQELITDDRGRIWIDVIDQPASDSTTWTIVDLEAQEVIETQLPEKVSIRYIRDGKIYGIRADENGLDEVVVFEIRNV